jgi:hypothetical protein
VLLVLNDCFEVVYATVGALFFSHESVTALCALDFNFRTFLLEVLFDLSLCHLLGGLASAG